MHGLNDEFKTPLPEREAQQIAASIVRWIVSESRLWKDGEAVYEATFHTAWKGYVTRKEWLSQFFTV